MGGDKQICGPARIRVWAAQPDKRQGRSQGGGASGHALPLERKINGNFTVSRRKKRNWPDTKNSGPNPRDCLFFFFGRGNHSYNGRFARPAGNAVVGNRGETFVVFEGGKVLKQKLVSYLLHVPNLGSVD